MIICHFYLSASFFADWNQKRNPATKLIYICLIFKNVLLSFITL